MRFKIRQTKVLLLLVTVVLFFSATVFGAILVFEEPGLDPEISQTAHKVIDSFNKIVILEMKTSIVKKVRVYLCPTEKNYITVLKKQFYLSDEEARAKAEISGGLASESLGVIAVRLDHDSIATQRDRAYNTTAHELVHQLQFDLEGNSFGGSLYWVTEGSADLIGAVIAERCGYGSLEQWKFDQINELRTAKKYAAINSLGNISGEEWDDNIKNDLHPYQVSSLMVLYLMNLTKEKFYESLVNYWGQVSTGREDSVNFTEAFGFSTDNFYKQVQPWLDQKMQAPTQIEINGGGPELQQGLRAGFDLCQTLLKEKFAASLRSHQKVIVAADRSTYLLLLSKKFGLSATEAEEATQDNPWRFNDGTTVIQSSLLGDRQKCIFHLSSITMKKFLSEQASPAGLNVIRWLRNGIADNIGALTVERSGLASVKGYRQSWLKTIREAKATPLLTELRTSDLWDQAVKKYGKEVVTSYAALASLYLIETKGLAKTAECLTGYEKYTSKEAFVQAFGLSLEDFSAQFAEYIKSQ